MPYPTQEMKDQMRRPHEGSDSARRLESYDDVQSEASRLRALFLAERKAREGDLRTLQCIAQAYICNKSADYANDQLRDYEAKTAALLATATEQRDSAVDENGQ